MRTGILTTFILGIVTAGVMGAAAAPQAESAYVVDKEWAKLPPGMTWDASTTSIAPDRKGNVTVLVRTAPYFRVFDRSGKFIKSWGEAGFFVLPHSIMFDRDGFIWTTDSDGHVVHKFSPEGNVLLTLGKKGQAGENDSREFFNRPNAVAIAANGDILVSDGYVNSRVVRFSKEGKFLSIIGGVKGNGPGQLQLPHGIAIDSKGRLLVSDSDNKRIAVFDKDGKFVENWPFPSRGGSYIAADDTLYVSEVSDGTIRIIKEGKLIDSVTGLGRPHWASLDTDGTLYASDSTNRTVMKITKKK